MGDATFRVHMIVIVSCARCHRVETVWNMTVNQDERIPAFTLPAGWTLLNRDVFCPAHRVEVHDAPGR